ncbi:hypothetical protein DFO73_1347 [Cytobacillus oceanisediminis]|uniref:Uncharacterized protein n=1 Tax=Cytobacillus oceanisediminis TaxID=665099 RepID=A0A2V2ZAF7_9BACI|nr:hypothetical protein [Cytobacillus oceanisediminis]PWW17063.1 hypothetical protein DFO73_1347 [Cytobacillus oceanisediminis]
MEYLYKVAWCPICSQGWIEIVKDVETKELFLMCEECLSEWEHPNNVTVKNVISEINDNQVTAPTHKEIRSADWEKYIIKE